MKTFRYLLFALLAVLSFSACTSEVDDVFDQSSAERIQTSLNETQKVLESAPNGWLMYYYGNTDFGGYNVYCRFNGGKVTVQSELFADKSATTDYKLEQSAGVVLSFNQYNYIFHFFSDPSVFNYADSISEDYEYLLDNVGQNGKAFEGDFEFRVMSASADSVVLQGKKHADHIVMYPAPDNFSWDNYLSQLDDVDESVFESSNYLLHLSDTTVLNTSQSLNHRIMTIVDENGESHDMPYIVVPGGIKLYQPLTLDGKTFDGFNVDDGAVFTATNGSGVTLSKYARPLVEQLIDGLWQISYSNYGSYGQPWWDYTQNRQSSSFALVYLYIGTNQFYSNWQNAFGIHMRCGRYYGALSLKADRKSDDEVTLTVNEDNEIDNGNGPYFYENLRYYYMLYPLAGLPGDEDHPNRTFKITVEGSVYSPTALILTDESDPTNVIKVDQNFNTDPYHN